MMFSPLSLTVISAATLGFALFSPIADADDAAPPVALAYQVKGISIPHIDRMSELTNGASIVLMRDAEIEFVHYAMCRVITIKGGRVSFRQFSFALFDGARVIRDKAEQCPKIVSVNPNASVGGVQFRTILHNARPIMAARPSFILLGNARNAAALGRIRQGETVVYETSIRGFQIRWPTGKTALPAGEYSLDVLGAMGLTLSTVNFRVSIGGAPQKVLLIRVE